ncbi:hypothetical protein Goklo_021760 [Gossypium klotzschianum]|uniref:Uncharacterized protein n=1 Tax=Gossypium klotzschianum TaxID=34286 RepID=A0A7J8UWI2_9ROSI|nr:hypothetical protein [Gossypium klotzschianum]
MLHAYHCFNSSANKVHTHAWCLSRLYIHACKHWSGDKQAMITKNTVSGLILITKSCCNDASSCWNQPQATKSFLIDLRKMAFEDAFQLTFPVGAGAMNVVACQLLQVMEQCVARLDVAMFYAILWESENEVPTDPISNPIVDSKRKAYTSDEELNSPLTSTIEKLLLSPTIVAKGSMNGEHKLDGYGGLIALYKLLREVWLIQFVSVGFFSQLQRKLQLEA